MRGARLVIGGVALVALAIGGAALLAHDPEAPRDAARWTARWSLVWYVTAYLGGVLLRRGDELSPTERRAWLALASAHVVHLGFVAYSVVTTAFPLIPMRVAGGALAYTLILVVAWGAHREARWTRLLADVGGLYVGVVFLETFRARVTNAETSTETHVILLALTGGTMLFHWIVLAVRRFAGR